MDMEDNSLLNANANNLSYGARGNGSGARTPTNAANAPQPGSPTLNGRGVRIVTEATAVLESDAVLMHSDPAPGTFPVRGWDVTDTGGAGHHLCYRGSPWRLLGRDLRWVGGHLFMLPWLVLPTGYDNSSPAKSGFLSVFAQIVMIPISLIITIGFLTSAVVGIPPMILALGILLLFIWIAEKAQGATTRLVTSDQAVGTDTEAWFFVNGVMTTNSGAEDVAVRLHDLFKRPIVAVLNRSFGLWFDLLECMMQRDLLLTTSDIRQGYKTVRKAVLDPRRKRIVIIGHSQGGIITSAWVDMLLTDVPAELLARVEVYTFASAANHFSRPAAAADGRGQTFAHVEHFANENDFVAQFGVLGYAPFPGNELNEGDDSRDPLWQPCTPATPVAAHGRAPWSDGGEESEAEGPQAPIIAYDPSQLSVKDKLVRAQPVFDGWRGGMLPNAIGDFGGRVFLRLNHSGHLYMSHYIHPESSILNDPFVRKHSQLVTYLGGQNVRE
ncbi:hypothetical protein CC85DRAFT_285337 [Cutaneotrichosporon oleaginosum]|uniref:DUF676 domain-containing protein n=1 Tax=Cutaneotrichosporon oleaginosum TaxID=879819 RepID=A0A0J1B4K5_9TREE|nr:uncharacterized protein CC85DRAFT_285337 [Cutaneotrichosporon oleaginosum]KLT42604.1 hypothetical protein CC85DRAFT_285337 [Cutaneotrichosporon oleaginosum]TXT05279.1 hypothetical protein COLE_06599 [Cutaneotrichosporon oleaginosum]